jgi:cell division protein FtsB
LPQRDDANRGEPGLRKKAGVLGTVIVLLALVVGSIFGDRGLINLFHKREQVQTLRLEIEALRADNAQLVREVAALKQSPRAIERLAREELGLARPDETVFLIREEDPAARP